MTTLVPIGEFSRLTHLAVKTLRHYHDIGLLHPYEVDDVTGYRRYTTGQVPDALLIGRLRAGDAAARGAEGARRRRSRCPRRRDRRTPHQDGA